MEDMYGSPVSYTHLDVYKRQEEEDLKQNPINWTNWSLQNMATYWFLGSRLQEGEFNTQFPKMTY